MRTAEKSEVGSARASLQAARDFVKQTLSALEELRQRRAQIVAEVEALAARPLPWAEVVGEAVAAAVDGCAATYKAALADFICERNPNLARRAGYDDLPFLRVQADSPDGTSSAALCFLMGDILKAKLRELLLTFDAPHPEDQCIGATDRATRQAGLDAQLRIVDTEIAQLQGELDQLKGF